MPDAFSINIVLLCITAVIAISIVAAAIAFVLVGRAAFAATSPSAAGAFGLLFLALPALMTITLIIVATAVLTSFGYINSNGCIAIFSSVASFVLGAESQKRKIAPERRDAGSQQPFGHSSRAEGHPTSTTSVQGAPSLGSTKGASMAS